MTARIATFIGFVAVPIVGILFFGWDWRSVILLYWLENITVGLRNVVSMSRTEQVADPQARSPLLMNGRPVGEASRVGLVLFFMVHYGIFTVVHGVFVMVLVFTGGLGPFRDPTPFVGSDWLGVWGIVLVWGIASLVQIIADCFVPRSALPPAGALFLAPYGRILALHITILGGAWLIMSLNWPPSAAILLVVLHFVLDLWNPLGRSGAQVRVRLGSSG